LLAISCADCIHAFPLHNIGQLPKQVILKHSRVQWVEQTAQTWCNFDSDGTCPSLPAMFLSVTNTCMYILRIEHEAMVQGLASRYF